MARRTPDLTNRARTRFEELWWEDDQMPMYDIIEVVAEETGLSHNQVLDALFAESADKWRRSTSPRKVQS